MLNYWNEQEIERLAKYYPISTKEALLKMFPGRTWSSILTKANKLAYLLDCFCEEQSKYPLGDCVRKDIHILFHHLYGQYDVNENQWEQFKQDYRDGIYDNYKMNVIA